MALRSFIVPLLGFASLTAILVSLLAIGSGFPGDSSSSDGSQTPKPIASPSPSDTTTRQAVPMSEMIDLAETALRSTIANVNDYTARLVKHEQDRSGVLQPKSESFIKVATRHPGGKPGAPMKVYLRFDSPDDVKGREVIWVENENDGNLLIREAGMIGSMMTVPIAPDSFLAMRGQRYPITEIGLTRLLEKLIERGREDEKSERVHAFKTEGHRYDGRDLTLLEIERDAPSDRKDDFSIAELVLDRSQNVVVSFRSFGWPESQSNDAPLIESYQYYDLKLNVGLTDIDFSTANPDYTFKK